MALKAKATTDRTTASAKRVSMRYVVPFQVYAQLLVDCERSHLAFDFQVLELVIAISYAERERHWQLQRHMESTLVVAVC